jgi:spoIIIJ-associated protein
MGSNGFFGLFKNKQDEQEQVVEQSEDLEVASPGNEREFVDEAVDEKDGNVIDSVDTRVDEAKSTLTEILDLMGFFSVVRVGSSDDDELVLEIEGDDLGRVIGKDGTTLDALQHMLRVIMSRRLKTSFKVSVDANNYRQKHYRTIRSIAIEAAQRVKETVEEVEMKPMNAADRRVVHTVLSDEGVRTGSVGDRKSRRVVVSPL